MPKAPRELIPFIPTARKLSSEPSSAGFFSEAHTISDVVVVWKAERLVVKTWNHQDSLASREHVIPPEVPKH